MERVEKLFVALSAAVLLAVIAHDYRSPLRAMRLNVSATDDDNDSGPAYMLSNLPERRVSDDRLPHLSYPSGY